MFIKQKIEPPEVEMFRLRLVGKKIWATYLIVILENVDYLGYFE